MFGVGMAPKEILSLLLNPFKDIRLVLGNLVMIATYMCRKSLSRGSGRV